MLTILGELPWSCGASHCELAQVRFQPRPVRARVAKCFEESGLEAPHRMRLGEQIVAHLRGFNLDMLSGWQFHAPILARIASRRRDVAENGTRGHHTVSVKRRPVRSGVER